MEHSKSISKCIGRRQYFIVDELSSKNRQKCAEAFVKSLIDFKQIHFDLDLQKIS